MDSRAPTNINVKTVASRNLHDNGDSGAAATINFANGNRQKITLTDDAVMSAIPPKNNRPATLHLLSIQGAGGGHVPTWSGFKTSDGAVLTPTLTDGAEDYWVFEFDGTYTSVLVGGTNMLLVP